MHFEEPSKRRAEYIKDTLLFIVLLKTIIMKIKDFLVNSY